MDTKLHEITIIKQERKNVELFIGDRNEFDYVFQAPAIDQLSFMPKYMDPDEEYVVTQWTPTFVGKVIHVRYYIYTRLLFDGLDYDRCQRMANEVRIFKLPEYLFSDLPTGYERNEDPFTYYNGGTRKLLQEPPPKDVVATEVVVPKPQRVGRVMEKSLNLTDSIRIGDFSKKDIMSPMALEEPNVSALEIDVTPATQTKKSVRFGGENLRPNATFASAPANQEQEESKDPSSSPTPTESKSHTVDPTSGTPSGTRRSNAKSSSADVDGSDDDSDEEGDGESGDGSDDDGSATETAKKEASVTSEVSSATKKLSNSMQNSSSHPILKSSMRGADEQTEPEIKLSQGRDLTDMELEANQSAMDGDLPALDEALTELPAGGKGKSDHFGEAVSEGNEVASQLRSVVGSSALFRSSEMSEPVIEIGALTDNESERRITGPPYEWSPDECYEPVACEPGRANLARNSLYAKQVLDPQRGSFNRHARLHVQKEEITRRIYDQTIVDAHLMNEKHREVLTGQMESMLRGPSPPITSRLMTADEVTSEGAASDPAASDPTGGIASGAEGEDQPGSPTSEKPTTPPAAAAAEDPEEAKPIRGW